MTETDAPPVKKQKTMATAAATGNRVSDAAPSTKFAPPLPPFLQLPASSPPELVAHGAEAHLYKTTAFTLAPLHSAANADPTAPADAALKFRPPKPYRHPALDARLTRQRILSEARILARCRRDGVAVPGILAVDENAGWLMMEWVAGEVVRAAINRWITSSLLPLSAPESREADRETTETRPTQPLRELLRRMGEAVGALHGTGVIHGDLTTSNMMLRPTREDRPGDAETAEALAGEVVVIDFGLANQSTHEEDRAVDLYVLERAFGSTHPSVEHLFAREVLPAYGKAYEAAGTVLKRLDEVRMRGRKRSMLG